MKTQILGVAYPRAAYGHRLDVRSSNYRDRLAAVATGIAWLTTVINALDALDVLIGRIQARYNRFVNSPASRGSGLTSIDIPTGFVDNRFGTGEIHLVLTVLSRASIGYNHTVYTTIRDVWRKRQRFGKGDWKEVA